MEYYKHGVDEKLYLQTDKPYYSTNETIWIKGYLVNAITHAPLNNSNFIYVELTNTEGELFSRIEIRRDSTSGFSGYLDLDSKMDAGEYMLRGYTKWMTNSDRELFFQKNIPIISPIPEGSAAAKALNSDEPTAKERREAAKKERAAEAQKLEYNLQFFPEGGGLVAGVPQLVAFKALAEDGLSIELKGAVYNSKDEFVSNIETFNDGMGYVQLNIPEGEQYYAEVRSAEYVSRRFDLPLSSASQIALKVSRSGTNFYYQVLANSPEQLEEMNVIIHTRGKIVSVNRVEAGKAHRISQDLLLDGVSVISVVDRLNRVVSERIVFKKPVASPTISFTTNATNYEAREMVTLDLQIKGSDGNPSQGEFAISVVDDKTIPQDSTLSNAVSYLLLSSEIKGNIENPGSYFIDNSKLADSKLDLLMMTQGWRRFDLEKILDPTTNHRREVQYEDMVRVDGEVKGFFGNDARKPTLAVTCQRLGLIDSYELDESNRFSLLELDVPDSAVYVIYAKGRNGGNYLTLKVNEERLPDPVAAKVLYRDREIVPFSFINQSMESFYNDGGLRMIELEAVEVKTQKVSKIQNSAFASKNTTREDLQYWGTMSLENLLYTYTGFKSDGTYVYYQNSSDPVNFYVNGMEEMFTNLSFITVDLIEEIAFFTESEALGLYTNRVGGVFSIVLVDGASIPRVRRPNIISYVSQGYQASKEFYQPTYETKWKKDNLPMDSRTTIFWSGEVTPDQNGDASVEFYTADKSTNYKVIVEGVMQNGEICHSEYMIERTK
ncbi:MAG: hypothetical protein SNG02_02635 [Rikenellaceae bacterium]